MDTFPLYQNYSPEIDASTSKTFIKEWCILDDPGKNQAPAACSVNENKMYWKRMGENIIGDDCINMRTPIRVKKTLIRQFTGSILRYGTLSPLLDLAPCTLLQTYGRHFIIVSKSAKKSIFRLNIVKIYIY